MILEELEAGMYNKSCANDFKLEGKHVSSVILDGKRRATRSFAIWTSIKGRCTEGSAFQRKFPHYIGTTLCKEWADDFQVFADWYTSQTGYKYGWDVDKDIISGEKHYSSYTCTLLPRNINLMFSDRARGLSICDATKKDGVPRWRYKDGFTTTVYSEIVRYVIGKRLTHAEQLRREYVYLGVPEKVFDKLVAHILTGYEDYF